jgi:argininosuccinate lyase
MVSKTTHFKLRDRHFFFQENNKLWGGRFTESTDANLEKLNSSINFDKRMFAEDIEGSKAYASALEKINLLSEQETSLICDGLDKVKIEWEKNVFETKHGDEDIHTANERRLQVSSQKRRRFDCC